MSTQDNLKEAFAGESQANRKYLAFSEKAKEEGFDKVSRLFQVVAEAETIHALKHLQVMQGVGSTQANLKAAITGEHYEFTDMYPPFIDEAEKDDNQPAKDTFHLANQVEKIHHKLYSKALESVEQKRDIQAKAFFLCPKCGNVEENEAPGRCPVCETPGTSFKYF